MKAYTDYPFDFLLDSMYIDAPIREVKVLKYDGDKYCTIVVEGIKTKIKRCYIYRKFGRLGDVKSLSNYDLYKRLRKERTKYERN